ncbi:MAG: TraB/GumN family protein [Oscillospiraceae bacterium]|nr:TraB/GumN family protein [Oscillospiraceae bacterium]
MPTPEPTEVVGLAHLLGEDGLVALLTEAGYNVEQIVY